MDKFYWEPDRDDKIGIIGGIFEKDGLSRSEIEQLVDSFPHQSIDFFSAVRSRIYDEQIRQFIHQTGISRVSSRVVNSVEGPPTFIKPDFRLSRLIEFGNVMVNEQQRVQNTRLVEEYNTGRRSPNPVNQEVADANKVTTLPKENWKAVVRNELANEPTHSHGSNLGNGHTSNGLQSSKLSSDTQQQVRQILAQGYRIGAEYADKRRFSTQSWQSCAPIQATEATDAIAALEECLAEHTGEYVRLIGIDPKAKRRVAETILQRPNS
jgi:ribulose bisphosphate carboxylase small subunit